MTKLESKNPDIASMVSELGGDVSYHGGAYWLTLGSMRDQLTGYAIRNDSPIGEAENIEIARKKLAVHIEARKQWGTVTQRAAALLEQVRKAVPLYRPCMFQDIRLPGGDCATLFAAGYSPVLRDAGLTFGEWLEKEPRKTGHSLYVDLIGEDKREYKGQDFDEAIDAWVKDTGNSPENPESSENE